MEPYLKQHRSDTEVNYVTADASYCRWVVYSRPNRAICIDRSLESFIAQASCRPILTTAAADVWQTSCQATVTKTLLRTSLADKSVYVNRNLWKINDVTLDVSSNINYAVRLDWSAVWVACTTNTHDVVTRSTQLYVCPPLCLSASVCLSVSVCLPAEINSMATATGMLQRLTVLI